jgi:chromosome segregation ATPase
VSVVSPILLSATTTMAAAAASPAKPPQQPVMSLLDKYSNLHRSIDQAREETADHRSQIQENQQLLEKLMEDRHRMEADEQKAQEQRQELAEETDQALKELIQIEQDYALEVSNKDQAKTHLEAATQRADAYRQIFLEATRDFRSACKRLCVRGGRLGMMHAPLGAYAVVHQEPQLQTIFQDGASQPQNDGDHGGDHNGDHDGDDHELEQALERLKDFEKTYLQAKEARDNISSKKEESLEKAGKRNTQRRQLQSQLDRIMQDVQDVKEQNEVLQQQTKESREMASNFEKGELPDIHIFLHICRPSTFF